MPKHTVAEQEINLLEFAYIIVRHKRFIGKFCLAAASLAVVVALILPNIYSGVAKVLPPQKDTGGVLSSLLGQMGGLASLAGGSLGMGGTSDLYVGILKSRSVADAVIKRFDLAKIYKTKTADETRKKLAKKITVLASKDGIITLTIEDRDPVRAAGMANAFVEELGRKSVQLNLTKAGTERVFLEKRLVLVKQDLKKAEEELKAFQEKYKIVKVDSQALVAVQGIAKLKADLISKEVQLAALRNSQTDENNEVRTLLASISKLRTQLGAMSEGGRENEVIPAFGNIPNLGLEYLRLMRELKIQETIFEQLTKQFELAKLNEAKDSSTLQILDEAVVPQKKSKPYRSLIVLLTTILAFFIAVVTSFFQEYLEKMPDEDRTRWQEIKEGLSFLTRFFRRSNA